MTAIIIVLLLLGFIVYTIYPAIHAPHSSEFTTQDGLEDVVKEETTKDIVNKNNIELEKKLLNVDFVEKGAPFDEPLTYGFKEKEEKCPTHETEGVRQLSEHIKDIIQKNPEKVKRLNKREKKVVKKMSDKSWNPGYYDPKQGFIEYEKRWYCNTNKLIHQNEKEFLNCNHCNKK